MKFKNLEGLATDKQKRQLEYYGISYAVDISKQEASDRITRHKEQRIARRFKSYPNTPEGEDDMAMDLLIESPIDKFLRS